MSELSQRETQLDFEEMGLPYMHTLASQVASAITSFDDGYMVMAVRAASGVVFTGYYTDLTEAQQLAEKVNRTRRYGKMYASVITGKATVR